MNKEDVSLDFIDDLVALERANNSLLEIAEILKTEGKIARRLIHEEKLFNDDINEGTLSSFRRAQARAEALIEKLIRFGSTLSR